MLKNSLIIIPSYQSKYEVCDFLQQTAKVLSENNHVYIIDYTTQISIKEILLTVFSKKKISLVTKYKKFNYLTPISLLPFRKLYLIRQLNMKIYFIILQILFLIYYSKTSSKIIWMFFPQLSFLIKNKFFFWKSIYDISDFYTHHNFKKNKKLKINKQKLLKKSDYLCAISHSLKKEFSNLTKKNITIVPQGFDIDSFGTRDQNTQIKIPTNKKIIGFIGQINQRLDFNLLNNLITNNPQWNFIFIGPKNFNKDLPIKNEIIKIFNKPNCFWYDKQEKSTIPAIINQFDITMIPYDISLDFNRLCYPMKLFEYFYLEKPVVSTPIKELTLIKFSDVISIGENYKEWEKIINNILKQKWPDKNKIKQRKLAKENSWKNKINFISNNFFKDKT